MVTNFSTHPCHTSSPAVNLRQAEVVRGSVEYGTTSYGRRIEVTLNSLASILDALNKIILSIGVVFTAILSIKEMWRESSNQGEAPRQRGLARRNLRQVPTGVI